VSVVVLLLYRDQDGLLRPCVRFMIQRMEDPTITYEVPYLAFDELRHRPVAVQVNTEVAVHLSGTVWIDPPVPSCIATTTIPERLVPLWWMIQAFLRCPCQSTMLNRGLRANSLVVRTLYGLGDGW